MKKQQSGFTLIELVVVIVILGILAATALPKFIDLRSDANAAAAKGFAGALSAASALNMSGCAVTAGVATTDKCVVEDKTSAKCSNIGALVSPPVTFTVGALPTPTVQGTPYIVTASDVLLTIGGATCNFVYGDGTNTGIPATFIGYATK